MTQDVQPLTWQKRTNLEEHQQFFNKINEIIANLAPTVDEAEAAIAQATAAIASANDAIATANAASVAASAAASQAQTAASTVAGYDTRLTAAEDSIDAQGQQITVLQGRAGALETGMTALGTRMTAAETKNSQQDTAISALQTDDANNVKITGEHAIGNYAVLLTGNQDMAGIKRILSQYGTSNFVMKGVNTDVTEGIFQANVPRISFVDKNDVVIVTLLASVQATGSGQLQAYLRNADGTYKYVQLANGD